MFEPGHKLRHLPFFDEIATLEEETPAWHASTAGLVVLRLVDAWLAKEFAAGDTEWSIRSVRAAIEGVPDRTPVRAILDRVVDAVEGAPPGIHAVVTPLMAYARVLEYEAKWLLAADVYHTLLGHLHPVEDSESTVAAHMRLGNCYRNLHLIDEATQAFSTASQIAMTAGDTVNVVLARVHEGHIAVLRGNLPQAEHILDEAIARASEPGFADVRSRALHERANVAHYRKQYELAVQLGYAAFRLSQSPSERDRILNDMAVDFSELGVFSAARDAYLVLSATAQEQFMRWAATINLMDLSAQTGNQILFELYRRQLVGVNLPPFLATGFELNVGLAYRRFGESEKAKLFLRRAMAMAEEHRLNQYLFEAEEALLEMASAPPPKAETEPSLDLREVASAIRTLRESVGAG